MTHDEETILVFAFRYALGRRSSAPFFMTEEIKRRWGELKPFTQAQIKHEIKTHEQMYGSLGDNCDKETWYELLELKTKDETTKTNHNE